MTNISGNYFEFEPWVQEEISFKDTSYLKLLWPFCSAGQKTICANLVKGIMRKIYVKLFFTLAQWFRRRCRLKKLLT